MLMLFGAPLVGPLFVPIVVVGIVMVLLLAGSRWFHQETGELKHVEPLVTPLILPLTDESFIKSEVNGNTVQDHTDPKTEPIKKKKKKKKSCCGTKGSCCKTKKETGEEKKGGCGCGCSSKKKEGEEGGDGGSCSSSAGSDSDGEAPLLIDVEELGIIAEGLRPDLATRSPPRPTRTSGGVPVGRVRLRTGEQTKQAANNKESSQ